jgi:hypothetical protein
MKFCDTQCRSEYHNKKSRETDAELIRINSILRKNRTILKSLNPIGLTQVRAEYMRKEGFNFKYFTHVYETRNKHVYHFCYEYGYMTMDDDKVRIVTWQKYMEDV